ncbi:MAG: hypothetical protein ACLFRT_15030 [Actinomycetota bacterium]
MPLIGQMLERGTETSRDGDADVPDQSSGTVVTGRFARHTSHFAVRTGTDDSKEVS